MVKTRFAPKPHRKSSYRRGSDPLFNYLYAKHHRGILVLRIEDTDIERSKLRVLERHLAGPDLARHSVG